MTSGFHKDVGIVAPWQATYSFPSQGTQVKKQIIKIQPQNGATFSPTGTRRIRFNLPSDGYLNCNNSAVRLRLTLKPGGADADVTSYTGLVSAPTGAGVYTISLFTAAAGAAVSLTQDVYANRYIKLPGKRGLYKISANTIAGVCTATRCDFDGTVQRVDSDAGYYGKVAVWTHYACLQKGGIHEVLRRYKWEYGGLALEDMNEYGKLCRAQLEASVAGEIHDGSGNLLDASRSFQNDDPSTAVYDVCFNMYGGLARSSKLLPLKWMAAQNVIDLELAPFAESMLSTSTASTYEITEVSYIAEIVEFDSVFDSGFYLAMRNMGIPIKFTSWHNQTRILNGSQDHAVHERARSLKNAMVIVADDTATMTKDRNLMYYDAGDTTSAAGAGASPMVSYQWRVGGRYLPAQPVDCTGKAVEAYLELAKTLNTYGSAEFSSAIRPKNWTTTRFAEFADDGKSFIMATEFENTDVTPSTISGINTENQSDLSVKVNMTGVGAGKTLHIFTSFDNLLIIRDGHLVDLVM